MPLQTCLLTNNSSSAAFRIRKFANAHNLYSISYSGNEWSGEAALVANVAECGKRMGKTRNIEIL